MAGQRKADSVASLQNDKVKKDAVFNRFTAKPHRIEAMKYLIALLAVAGIVVSSMALRIHLMDPSQAPPCAVTEHFDCGKVNHGRFSIFPPLPPPRFDESGASQTPNRFHLPVAVLGIVGYGVIGLLALLEFHFLTFELAQIAFFFALFLTAVEKYVLDMWCIYCLWSQIIIATIFVLSLLWMWRNWQRTNRPEQYVAR